MASQIEQLRTHFSGLNTTQKKQFIDNLKQKLQGNTNAEYKSLLNWCVQQYNAEIQGSSPKRTANNTRNDFDDLVNDTSNYNIAQPAERLIAWFIDMLFALPGYILIYLQYYFLGSYQGNLPNYMEGFYSSKLGMYIPSVSLKGNPEKAKMFLILSIVIGLIGIVYLIFVLIVQIKYWKKGTSFGKNKKRLFVVNKETGEKISMGYMFLREFIGKQISSMLFSLGLIWILIDKDKQAWHDKLVSSVVIKK